MSEHHFDLIDFNSPEGRERAANAFRKAGYTVVPNDRLHTLGVSVRVSTETPRQANHAPSLFRNIRRDVVRSITGELAEKELFRETRMDVADGVDFKMRLVVVHPAALGANLW